MSMRCPICGRGELKKQNDLLPKWLNPSRVAREESPLPVVGDWAADKMDEAREEGKKHAELRKCDNCGYLAWFDKS